MSITKRKLWGAFAAQGLDPKIAFDELALKVPGPKVERRPRECPSEWQEQVAVCHWWGRQCGLYGLDYRLLYAVPNGSFLHGDGQARARQVQFLKSSGMRNGMTDLALAVARGGYHGLYMEMKARDGHVAPAQTDIHDLLAAQGYRVKVAYGSEQGIATIREYIG